MSQDEARLQHHRVYLSKLNLILVQILKQEWPHNWCVLPPSHTAGGLRIRPAGAGSCGEPSDLRAAVLTTVHALPSRRPNFIPDIVEASQNSETLCENNMHILRLLSEEIFDFSTDQMTIAKIKELKERLNNEFSGIFQLCSNVLEHARSITRPSLVTATLQTLLRFLNWIPLVYVFQTNIIDQLVVRAPGRHADSPRALSSSHTLDAALQLCLRALVQKLARLGDKAHRL